MYLPECLTKRRFADWNYLVRGIMEIWEVSREAGLDGALERWMEEDAAGALAEKLGRLGNDLLNARYRSPLQVTRTTRRAQAYLDLLRAWGHPQTIDLAPQVTGIALVHTSSGAGRA